MIRHLGKLRVLYILMVLTVFITACDQRENNREIEQLPQTIDNLIGEGVFIGLSMDTLLEERWLRDRDLFVAAAENMGAEVNVQAANGDDEKQMSQAENLISLGVDILVIIPHNAAAMAPIVDKAHAAGIKVLSYDRLITDAQLDFYISFDNERVGKLQAEAIIKQKPKGNYVYMGGSRTDNNSHMLKKGTFSVLKPLLDAGDIIVLNEQFIKEWSPSVARAEMTRLLNESDERIDAVIAANDGIAGGVLEAIAAHGLTGEIPVSGQDAELAAIQRIVRGTQTMTVYKPIKQLTSDAAEIAIRLAKGEKLESDYTIHSEGGEIPSVLLEPTIVDKSNIDETVIADGFHNREEVYK